MTLTKIEFAPGVHKDFTPLTNEGSFQDGDKIRFRDRMAENIGGWRKALASQVSGVPRAIKTWTTLSGQKTAAIGTSQKLYIFDGIRFHDITPYEESGTLGTDPFSVTSGSPVVTVTDPSHNRSAGDYVNFSGASAVGGITIDGEYSVTAVIDVSTYTVTHGSNATSTATGGGSSVAYNYEISIGRDDATLLYGWGAGVWNQGTWGTPRSSNPVVADLRVWTLDNWGEDLLCMPRGGNLYWWDATNGVGARAQKVAAAPTGEFFVVDGENREVIVFGADGDPLNIQWCDQNDFTDWTPTATNTADERRLLGGSSIVGALVTKGEILIWTDVALHGMQYTYRGDFNYALRKIGMQCGLIGMNAAASHGSTAWWMGNNQNFYVYDGRVRILSCPIRKDVFDNLTALQSDKVFAGVNGAHMEIWWFWQSDSGTENDRYTIYNFGENIWYHGTLERTAWADKEVFDYPLALDASGYLREHEYGKNDDGNALASYVETGEFDLGDGDKLMFLNGIVPDFVQSGTVQITLKARKWPNSEQVTKGPVNVTSSDDYIRPRIRGRQVSLRVGSNEVDASWRIGRLRFDAMPDGSL